MLCFSALTLAGCVATGPTYAALETTPQSVDELPDGLSADANDSADLATARFVAEHAGTSLWLTRGTDSATICLLAYQDESTWLIGCGGENGPIGIGGLVGNFTVVPDGHPGPETGTQISENVYTTSAD